MALRTNLFVVALALALFGNVMVYSATAKDFGTHYLVVRSAHVAFGVVAFLVAKRVRYTSWRKIAPVFYFVVLASLVLVLIPAFGTEVGGARRWFDLGPASVQPAEFAKLAAIFLLSCAVARARPGSGLPLRPIAGVGLLVVLVFLEPDFGTSVVVAAGAAGVLWASELRTADLLLAGGAAFGGTIVRAPQLMHGKVSMIAHDGAGVFSGLPNPFQATRYHSLIVERSTLPPELEVTAEADGLIMGLRHRALPIEGVQFHPESILTPTGNDLLANFLGRRAPMRDQAIANTYG